MDPVTHGLVGAASAQFFSNKETFRTATWVGFFAALAPDLDVFLGSASDPLLTLELHRQFTHSLFFIPFGAFIIASLMWIFLRKNLSFKATYLLSLAGYSTAGLMDYITSYGVYLFWPALDERYALNIVSVFDPILSVGLLILGVFAFYTKDKKYGYGSLSWLILYLCFAGFQQNRVEKVTSEILLKKNDSSTEYIIKPTIGNQILWSVRYLKEDELCSAGIRAGLFSKPTMYEGECVALLDWQKEYQAYKGSVLYGDIERFSKLSDGLLVHHPNHPEVIGDARYSMLPTTVTPLWGISIDTTNTENHVSFDSYRDTSPVVRSSFLDMLFGR